MAVSIRCREEFRSGIRLYPISLWGQDPYFNDVVSFNWTGKNVVGCCRGDIDSEHETLLKFARASKHPPRPLVHQVGAVLDVLHVP